MSTTGKSIRLKKGGFTLFELLVVIAILAVVAGLVVPQMDMNVGGDGIDSAVRTLRGVLDQARTQAKLTRSDVVLKFSPTSVGFTGGDKELRFSDSVRYREIEFAVERDEPVNELIISRRGIAPPAVVRIEVDGKLYSLMVSPVIRDLEYRDGTASFSDFVE